MIHFCVVFPSSLLITFDLHLMLIASTKHDGTLLCRNKFFNLEEFVHYDESLVACYFSLINTIIHKLTSFKYTISDTIISYNLYHPNFLCYATLNGKCLSPNLNCNQPIRRNNSSKTTFSYSPSNKTSV